jgi:hypothetical protein
MGASFPAKFILPLDAYFVTSPASSGRALAAISCWRFEPPFSAFPVSVRCCVNSAKLRVFVLWAVLGALAVSLAHAQIVSTGGVIVPTLKQQLQVGLLARTPDEQAFVDEVVSMVDSGNLPLSLVQSTFLWARRHRPYPMQYFERALRVRANDLGISL